VCNIHNLTLTYPIYCALVVGTQIGVDVKQGGKRCTVTELLICLCCWKVGDAEEDEKMVVLAVSSG
jgi:hypothetical protein